MDDDPARQGPGQRRGGSAAAASEASRAVRLGLVTNQSHGPHGVVGSSHVGGQHYLSPQDSFTSYDLPFDGLGGSAGAQAQRQDVAVRAPSQPVYVARHPHDLGQGAWPVARQPDPNVLLSVRHGNDGSVESDTDVDPTRSQGVKDDEGDEELDDVEDDPEGSISDFSHTLDSNMTPTEAQVRPRKCPFPGCPRTFFKEAHVVRHLVVHTKERNHRCPLCEATFSRADSRDRHMSRTHKISKEAMRELPEWSATVSGSGSGTGSSSSRSTQKPPVSAAASMRSTMTYLPGVGLVRRGVDASLPSTSKTPRLGGRDHIPGPLNSAVAPGPSTVPSAVKRKRTDVRGTDGEAPADWTPAVANRVQPSFLGPGDSGYRSEQPPGVPQRLHDPYALSRQEGGSMYPHQVGQEESDELRQLHLRSSYGGVGGDAYQQVPGLPDHHGPAAHQHSTMSSSTNAPLYRVSDQPASVGQTSAASFMPWRASGDGQTIPRAPVDGAATSRRDSTANDQIPFPHLPDSLADDGSRYSRPMDPGGGGLERIGGWGGQQGQHRQRGGPGVSVGGGPATQHGSTLGSSLPNTSGAPQQHGKDEKVHQHSLDAWLSAYATQMSVPESQSTHADNLLPSSALQDAFKRAVQPQAQQQHPHDVPGPSDPALGNDFARNLSQNALRLQHSTVLALTSDAPAFFPSDTMERYLRAAQQILRQMPCIPLIPLQEFGKNEPSVMMGLIVLGSLNDVRDGADGPPEARALARAWFLHNVSNTAAATWVLSMQSSNVVRLLQCVVVQELYASGDGDSAIQENAHRAWDDASAYVLSKVGFTEHERWDADLDVDTSSTRAWYLWRSSESRGRALTAMIVLDSQRSRGRTTPRLLPLLKHIHVPAPERLFRAESLEAWLMMARDFHQLMSRDRNSESTMPSMLQELYQEEHPDYPGGSVDRLQSGLPEHAQSLLLEAVHLNSMSGGSAHPSRLVSALPPSQSQQPSSANISRTFTALTNWRYRWETLVVLDSTNGGGAAARKDDLLLEFRWNAIALNVVCPPEEIFKELAQRCSSPLLQSEASKRSLGQHGTDSVGGGDGHIDSRPATSGHADKSKLTGSDSSRLLRTSHLGVPFAATILSQFRELPTTFLVPPQVVAAACDAIVLLAIQALRGGRRAKEGGPIRSDRAPRTDWRQIWSAGSDAVRAWYADGERGTSTSQETGSATGDNDILIEGILGWQEGAWAEGLEGSLKLVQRRLCAEEKVGWRDAARVMPVLRSAVRLARSEESRPSDGSDRSTVNTADVSGPSSKSRHSRRRSS